VSAASGTFILACITFLLAVATVWMAYETRKLVRHSGKQVIEIAREADAVTRHAEAANRQVEASIRPWLTSIPPLHTRLAMQDDPSWPIVTSWPGKDVFISVPLWNVGNGLALIEPKAITLTFGGGLTLSGQAQVPVVAIGGDTALEFMGPVDTPVPEVGDFIVSAWYSDAAGGQRVQMTTRLSRASAQRAWRISSIEYRRHGEVSPFISTNIGPRD
jgi:hypothetical protein